VCFLDRREVMAAGARLLALSILAPPLAAQALVKGSTPPKDFAKRDNRERATNIDEARGMGESKEAEMYGDSKDFNVAPGGDRYRDLTVGTGKELRKGDTVDIRYRVLKAGKRSADGLTGDGSLIFSYGYGEDSDKPGDVINVRVGDENLITALQESLDGMKEGGIRRIRILPERGWKKTDSCEKKLDFGTAVGLPGAYVTEMESCMDLERTPAPTTFQGKRKLARRFDGTLVLEVEAVKVN